MIEMSRGSEWRYKDDGRLFVSAGPIEDGRVELQCGDSTHWVDPRNALALYEPVASSPPPARHAGKIQSIDAIELLSRWRNLDSGVEATVTGVSGGIVVFRPDDGDDLFDRLEGDFRREFTPVVPSAAPAVKSFATGAVRSLDAESTRYDLVSPIGLRRLAETYAEGAAKYGAGNWLKGIPSSDLLNHLMKHVDSFRMGDESEDHLAHAAWGLFALMHFQETRPDLMDHGVFANCEKGAS